MKICCACYTALLPDVDPPAVNTEKYFGTDSVSIFLEWQGDLNNSLISYHVSIEPMVDSEVIITIMRGSNRANVPYNSFHSIRVVADFCGQINASTIIEVYYGRYTSLAYN